jgi:hypothetical protein
MEERGDLHVDSLSDTSEIKNINNIKLYLLKSEDFSNIKCVSK